MTDPEIEIAELDVADDAAYAQWHAVYAASQRHGREATATAWTAPELVLMMREQTTRRWRGAYLARRAGEVVGVASLVGSQLDNLDSFEVGLDVAPSWRGRGIGAALLAHLEQVARDQGRSVLQAAVSWPYDGDPLGAGTPDLDFAVSHGFTLGLVDIQRDLALPVEPALLDRLAADAATRHPAYTIEAWVGPVPDRWVDSWAALIGTLMTEAPTGEMEREVEVVDANAIREGEALAEAQGRTKLNAVALDERGSVVAYSDIATTVHEPGLAYQWGTLVHRDHRGHRLGMAVKVANLRQLQSERTDITSVRTWNAEVNSHMIGVNQTLGFVPVERQGELQKRLT